MAKVIAIEKRKGGNLVAERKRVEWVCKGSSLWSNYKKSTLQRLKVNYNNILRRLIGVPTYSSASFLFATLGVRSFDELLRADQYSLMKRVDGSQNVVICNILASDVLLQSRIRNHWYVSLYR